MNFVRPGILVACVAGVALSGFLLWMSLSDEPAPELSEGGGRPIAVNEALGAPSSASSNASPGAPSSAPQVPSEAATAAAVREAAEEEAETAAAAKQEAEVKMKARASYTEKLRREKLEKRRVALDRLDELKYPSSEAERIRETWESAIDEAEARLAELRLARAQVGAREIRGAYRDAYNGLREELGETDYGSARYGDQLQTWIGVRPGLAGNRSGQIGLEPMDQIYSYNGFRLFEVEEFGKLRAQEAPGGVATLGIVRDNKLFFLDVDLGDLGFPVMGRSVPPDNY